MLHSGEKKIWQGFSRLLNRRPSLKDFEKLMSNLFCDVDTTMNLGRILSRQLDWYLVSYQLHSSPRPNRILKKNMAPGDVWKLTIPANHVRRSRQIADLLPIFQGILFTSSSVDCDYPWATSNLRCACCVNNDNFWKQNGGWTTEVRSKQIQQGEVLMTQQNYIGGFSHVSSSPLPGEMIKFAGYFSNWLKPPTRKSLTTKNH